MDYGARYYDPFLGRFASADTIVPEPGEPQAFNRYAYVTNNPLRNTDPAGHWKKDVHYHLTWELVNTAIVNEMLKVYGDADAVVAVAVADRVAEQVAYANWFVDDPSNVSSLSIYHDTRHWDEREDGLADAEAAILAADTEAFGQALHSVQDYWSHTLKGYSGEPFLWTRLTTGHAVATFIQGKEIETYCPDGVCWGDSIGVLKDTTDLANQFAVSYVDYLRRAGKYEEIKEEILAWIAQQVAEREAQAYTELDEQLRIPEPPVPVPTVAPPQG